MKRAIFISGLCGLVLAVFAGCYGAPPANYAMSQQAMYQDSDENYNQGYQEGYNQAYQEGYNQAYQQPVQPPPPVYVQCAIPEQEFYELKDKVKYALNKDNYLKDVKSLTTAQVLELMYTVQSESQRTDIAASLYYKVCDVENWDLVYSAIFNSYTREEFRNRIRAMEASRPYNSAGAGYPPPSGGMAPAPMVQCGMPDGNFDNLKAAVKNASFQDDRKRILQAAAPTNTFFVSQVVEIMKTMSHDDDKIEAAVIMYPSVCDYNNWYMVYDALTFSSSKDELKQKVGQ